MLKPGKKHNSNSWIFIYLFIYLFLLYLTYFKSFRISSPQWQLFGWLLILVVLKGLLLAAHVLNTQPHYRYSLETGASFCIVQCQMLLCHLQHWKVDDFKKNNETYSHYQPVIYQLMYLSQVSAASVITVHSPENLCEPQQSLKPVTGPVPHLHQISSANILTLSRLTLGQQSSFYDMKSQSIDKGSRSNSDAG